MTPGSFASKAKAHPLERWGLVFICMGLAALGWILLRAAHRLEEPVMLAVVCGVIATCTTGAMMKLVGRRRGASQILGRGGRVCPRCRYPLSHAGEMGLCPECGTPFTHDENLALWRARYPGLRL